MSRQQPIILAPLTVLRSVSTLLGNLALENTGRWSQLFGRRWPISHEPLRSDAAWLAPQVKRLVEEMEAPAEGPDDTADLKRMLDAIDEWKISRVTGNPDLEKNKEAAVWNLARDLREVRSDG